MAVSTACKYEYKVKKINEPPHKGNKPIGVHTLYKIGLPKDIINWVLLDMLCISKKQARVKFDKVLEHLKIMNTPSGRTSEYHHSWRKWKIRNFIHYKRLEEASFSPREVPFRQIDFERLLYEFNHLTDSFLLDTEEKRCYEKISHDRGGALPTPQCFRCLILQVERDTGGKSERLDRRVDLTLGVDVPFFRYGDRKHTHLSFLVNGEHWCKIRV
jgi:hypothetical protein